MLETTTTTTSVSEDARKINTKNHIIKAINDAGQEPLKRWLKMKKLVHSATGKDELVNIIERHIQDAKITLDDLARTVIRIGEYGSKRVMLGHVDCENILQSKEVFAEHLARLEYALSDNPFLFVSRPKSPTLNYAYWSENEIRIKFTETHSKFVGNRATFRYDPTEITKIITLVIDPGTGFACLFMDAPEAEHPHRNGGRLLEQPYLDYYFNKITSIFDGTKFNVTDLKQLAHVLANDEKLLTFIPNGTSGTDEDDTEFSIRSRNKNIRKSKPYKQTKNIERVPNFVKGSWVADQSNEILQRDLYMELNCHFKRLRFDSDCLDEEINYAISKIREIQNPTPIASANNG